MNNFGIWKKGGWLQAPDGQTLRFETIGQAKATAALLQAEAGETRLYPSGIPEAPLDRGPQWTPAQVANYKARFSK